VPLTGWTWHDFRRSFATALGEAGIPETVADAIPEPPAVASRGGVLGVTSVRAAGPSRSERWTLWGKLLAEAITGGNTAPMWCR